MLKVAQLIKKLSTILGTRRFTTVLIEHATGHCADSHESSPHLYALFFNIHFNIVLFFPWLYSPWRTLAALHIGGFLNYLDMW
jgi:hypothetical protein